MSMVAMIARAVGVLVGEGLHGSSFLSFLLVEGIFY